MHMEVQSKGNLVGEGGKKKEKERKMRQGGRLEGMGEGRERQACSKAERQRGSETGGWPQPAGTVAVT